MLDILVWGLFFNLSYNNSMNYHVKPEIQASFSFHVFAYNALFFLLCNLNTLWLMPVYFLRRHYVKYFIGLGTLILVFTVCMSHYNTWILSHFKGLEDWHFFPVTLGTAGDNGWAHQNLHLLPTVLLILFIFSVGYLAQQYFLVKKKEELIRKKQMESELSLLKSQINPHFLFNVLNSIYALSLKKSDSTPEIVMKLSDILRYMLYETKQEKVSLEKEINMIESYVDIEKVRIGNQHQLSLELSGDFSPYVIAPVLLIPFVENAVKHGLDSMSEHAFVRIRIEVQNGMLRFYCQNNFKQAKVQRAGGIGLENVRKRLALLYPQKHELLIQEEKPIFTVSLDLSLTT